MYKPPQWAAAPSARDPGGDDGDASSSASSTTSTANNKKTSKPQWTLLEIKNGTPVAEHDLTSRAATVLGRAEDQVDIWLQHESCSRRHARIAFDAERGTPWLLDFQSTHGTKVNKQRLPPEACHKHEPSQSSVMNGNIVKGSRGVIIYPGDVLSFGASTRLYCLEGPEEYERGRIKLNQALKKAMPKASLASEASHQEQSQQQQQPIDVADIEDASQVPHQHRDEWEQIRALRYKIEQADRESNNILRKGNMDSLSDGQQQQLERLRQRMEQMQQSLDEKEAKLQRALNPSSAASSSQYTGGGGYNDHDDDEVEDRTAQTRRKKEQQKEAETVETEQSLLVRREAVLQEQDRLSQKLANALEPKRNALQQKIRQQRQKNDAEAAFYTQNELDMVQEDHDKIVRQKKTNDQKLSEMESLLDVVNPAWRQHLEPKPDTVVPTSSDRPSNNDTIKDDSGFVIPAPIAKPTTNGGDARSNFDLPPPPLPQKKAPPTDEFVLPAPQKASHDDMPPTSSQQPFLPPPAPKRSPPPASPPNTAKRNRTLGPSMPPPQSMAVAKSTNVAKHDPKEEKWRPPKDQDGSGFTKLNAKFGGRY